MKLERINDYFPDRELVVDIDGNRFEVFDEETIDDDGANVLILHAREPVRTVGEILDEILADPVIVSVGPGVWAELRAARERERG